MLKMMKLAMTVVGLISVGALAGSASGHHATSANEDAGKQTPNMTAVPPLRLGYKTFHVYTIKANWYRALQFCNSQNMRLASINSKLEQDMLTEHLINNGLSKTNLWFWLSGTDQVENREFVWIGTGRPMIYENWAPNQPDNAREVEHCVNLFNTEANFQWNDYPCDTPLYYICEQAPCDC